MLARFRALARPLAVLALVAFAAPAFAAECRPISGTPGAEDTMPCCVQPASGASLGADCCAVEQNTPAPTRVPSAPEAPRRIDVRTDLAVLALPSPSLPAVHAGWLPESTVAPPLERLYLRLSVIRR